MGSRQIGVIVVVLVAYASTIFQERLHRFMVLLGKLLHLFPIRAVKTVLL